MWKAILAGTAALAIAGSSLALAQQRWGRDGGHHRWQPSMEDIRAFGEARLAALKAGLALTPEQERNWPAFEQAAREFGRLRIDRMGAMRNAAPVSDPIERLRQRATAMSDTGAALRKLADATDPLYKSLDDSQKRRFEMLSRFSGGRHHFRGRDDGFRGRDQDDADDDDDDDEFRGRDGYRGRDGDRRGDDYRGRDGYDGPRRDWRRGDMDRMDREPSGRRGL
jgi:zinc resistance-associated protein